MKKENKHKRKMIVSLIVTIIFVFFLAFFSSDKLRSCYSLKLINGKEEVYSPDIYIDGSVWVENNYLLYRPFRAAYYITLKDSVASFKRIKCSRAP